MILSKNLSLYEKGYLFHLLFHAGVSSLKKNFTFLIIRKLKTEAVWVRWWIRNYLHVLQGMKSPNSKEWTNPETARLSKHWKPQRRPLKSVEKQREAGTKEE